MRVLAVSGSLQRGSTNTGLLTLAEARAPLGVDVELFDGLRRIAPFDPDDPPMPGVDEWRAAVAGADALLFATPEYAFGLPGTLKNALDWLVGSGDLYGKAAAIVSAAPSAERGAHARDDLERTLRAQGVTVLVSRTVAVPAAARGDLGSDPSIISAVDDVLAVVAASTASGQVPL